MPDGAVSKQGLFVMRYLLALAVSMVLLSSIRAEAATQSDVCAFVTDHANAGRLDELRMQGNGPINLLGDGAQHYVYIFFQGTMDIPAILAFTRPQKNVENDPAVQARAEPGMFSPLDRLAGVEGATQGVNPGDDIFLIAFNAGYYALDINYSTANNALSRKDVASVTVVQPRHGVICTVTPKITPTLVLSKITPLCDHFLKGTVFGQPAQDKSLAKQNIILAPGMGGDYILTATLKADLQNNGRPLAIAYYDYESGAGAGCSEKGLAVYDPVARKEKDSPLNDALGNLPIGCDGGHAYLIGWQGKTYIELDHGSSTLPGQARGAGIYQAAGDKLNPVCLIGNNFTYTAQTS